MTPSIDIMQEKPIEITQDKPATERIINGNHLVVKPKLNGAHVVKDGLLASIASLISQAKALSQDKSIDKATRYEIRTAALVLADSLETPVEQALRIVFETSPPVVALRIALEAGFLEALQDGQILTADQIAEQTKAAPALIARVMRILTAAKMADEVAAQTYAANPLTLAFLQPGISDAIKHGADIVNPIFAKLPVYLQNLGYQEPDSYTMGPHAFTYGRPLWEHLEAEPRRSKIFDKVMMAFKQNRENFVDIFPWEKETQLQLSNNEVFFVDVAGGIGHRAKDLKTRYPNLPGRVILQDLPHVLPSPKLEPEVFAGLDSRSIELMPHDIFTPQVVLGAKYYFFSAIFHGRPDGDCQTILRNMKGALKSGYSRILINDFVIKETQVNLFQASFDLWMLADVTGKERTEKEWSALVKPIGLRVEAVHRLGMDAVIEIGLDE